MQSSTYSHELVQRDLDKVTERIVSYITQGSSRRRLIVKAEKSFEKIHDKMERRRMISEFLRKLVEQIHQKRVFNVSGARIFIFRLWKSLGATSDEWGLLHRVAWYRTPTNEELKLDEYRSGKLWVEGRCTDLQEVSAIIGRRIESTRKGKSLLVSRDKQSEVLRRRVSNSGPSSSQTVGKELGESPPAKRNCEVASSQYQCQPREMVLDVRSIVVVPPQPSEKSRELEENLRNRLVEKLNARSSVPSGPSEIGARDESINESSMIGKDIVEGVLEKSNPQDHFLGPLNRKVIEEEQRRNKGSVKVKKCMPLFAIMDVEGQSPHLAEISVLLCDENELIEARIYHIKVSDEKRLRQGARYCHGIVANELSRIAKYNQAEALLEVRTWLESQRTFVTVLSADENENSDVFQLVKNWMVKYVPVPLPKWTERVLTKAYLETQGAKPRVVKLLEAECPYRILHSAHLLRDRNAVQVKDGPHCSLIDCQHLYRHIEINFLWPMIKRLSVHAKLTHPVECDREGEESLEEW
jgi:hypothetical protein